MYNFSILYLGRKIYIWNNLKYLKSCFNIRLSLLNIPSWLLFVISLNSEEEKPLHIMATLFYSKTFQNIPQRICHFRETKVSVFWKVRVFYNFCLLICWELRFLSNMEISLTSFLETKTFPDFFALYWLDLVHTQIEKPFFNSVFWKQL